MAEARDIPWVDVPTIRQVTLHRELNQALKQRGLPEVNDEVLNWRMRGALYYLNYENREAGALEQEDMYFTVVSRAMESSSTAYEGMTLPPIREQLDTETVAEGTVLGHQNARTQTGGSAVNDKVKLPPIREQLGDALNLQSGAREADDQDDSRQRKAAKNKRRL